MLYNSTPLFVLLFMLPFLAIAENDNQLKEGNEVQEFRHHVIILVDRSGSVKNKIEHGNNENALQNLLIEKIPELLFKPNEVLSDRELLQENDYLSIAFFGLGSFNKYNYEQFITQRIGFRNNAVVGVTYLEDAGLEVFEKLSKDIEQNFRMFFSGNFTGLSFAGPVGFNHFKQKEKRVHRTFVLIISDGQFHSVSDPSSELTINSVRDKLGVEYRMKKSEHIENVFSAVRTNYIWQPELKKVIYKPFQLNLYEYVPRKVLIQVCSNNSNEVIYQKKKVFDHGLVNVEMKKLIVDSVNDSLKMKLFFWVDFNDKANGTHQLHPFGSVEQGAEGLMETILISKEKPGKILGFLPFNNRMYKWSAKWMGERQKDNIRFWNNIMFLFLIFFLMIYTWRYIIKNREITDPRIVIIKTESGLKID